MIAMTLQQVQQAAEAELVNASDVVIGSVVIDSRAVKPGSLFVAIKGERQDGHAYLQQAAVQGASAALVETVQDVALPQLLVSNTVKAIADIARSNAQQFKGKVIAITGSSGKTTTKEMLVSILQQSRKVAFTQGNRNNELGVPLTVFSFDDDDDVAVVEMGAAEKGDIAYLMHIVSPDVAVITNVGNAHVGRFGSEAVIAQTKGEIYQGLKAGATAVVNCDDKYVDEWLALLEGQRVTGFSVEQAADVYASDIVLDDESTAFVLHADGQEHTVKLAVAGKHNVANALAAAACAIAAGATFDDVISGLQAFHPVASRLQVLAGRWGGKLIDDCYNASPGSVKASIDVLANYQSRKVLVLGDMAELGDFSQELHKQMGDYAKQRGVDLLLSCGVDSEYASQAFGSGGAHFADKDAVATYLFRNLQQDDVVLVKGSRSAAMETLISQLNKEGAL